MTRERAASQVSDFAMAPFEYMNDSMKGLGGWMGCKHVAKGIGDI